MLGPETDKFVVGRDGGRIGLRCTDEHNYARCFVYTLR